MEHDRYAAQVRFGPLGAAGQARLVAARAVIVGLGATGGTIAELLARAGVGHLTLVDRDVAEVGNLHRQPLLDAEDAAVGRPKALAAVRRLGAIAPDASLTPRVADLHAANAADLLGGHDLVVDGTDSMATRRVLNAACLRLGVPWVHAGVIGATGIVMAVGPSGRPCWRCLHARLPGPAGAETCETAGVIGPAVAVVGGLAARLAMGLLIGEPADGHATVVDVWRGELARFRVSAREGCPACGSGEPETAEEEGDAIAAILCGRQAVHLRPDQTPLDLVRLTARLAVLEDVRVANASADAVSIGWRAYEVTVFADGRAIVRGTDDPAVARTIYARLVGL